MSGHSRIFLFLFPGAVGAALAEGDRFSPGQALAKLHQLLTTAELVDLVEYLGTLKE